MDISEIASNWMPVESPVSAQQQPDFEQIKDASQKFEALLLNQFLGQALKPLLYDSLGSKAPGAHIYQHLLTDTISTQLSREESFGYANLLQMQLAGKVENNSETMEPSKQITK